MMESEVLQGPYVYEAKLLRTLRLEKDLRQIDIAERLGVSRQYIRAIEAAVKPISPQRAQEIANLFDVDISHILEAVLNDCKIKYLARVYNTEKAV